MSDDAFPAEWLENSDIPSSETHTETQTHSPWPGRWGAPEFDIRTRRQPVWFIPEYRLDSAIL